MNPPTLEEIVEYVQTNLDGASATKLTGDAQAARCTTQIYSQITAANGVVDLLHDHTAGGPALRHAAIYIGVIDPPL